LGKKGRNKKNKIPEKKSNPVPWIAAAVVLAVIGMLAVSGQLSFTGGGEKAGRSFNLPGSETRPVLDPAMFAGRVRAAYAAAEKYPEILNEVFCYCYCDEPPFNHKSLLSCFTEKHGAG